jgi:uncharacterized protein
MLREVPLKFTRDSPGTLTIRSVSKDAIQIDDQTWSTTIAVTPEEVVADWGEKPIADLSEEDFADLLGSASTSALEMVILGTGAKSRFPSRELMFAFARRGVGLEYMNTAAAARTFNVLVGEGRRVVAVLYLD